MANYHLRDKSLSLKAKGLLSLMLSLPENWDYSEKGLSFICKDGLRSISTAVKELEGAGYIQRRRIRDAQGRLSDVEYIIMEKPAAPVQSDAAPKCQNPILDNPIVENPDMENPRLENSSQLSKEEFNKVRDFMHSVGLPLTLEEVGITKEDVHQVAVASCVPGESIHNLSGDVSVKELEQAILLVDALDHDYLNNK